LRIILVDDDDAIRQSLIILLENLIGEVFITECANSEQALTALQDEFPTDLVICDYEMGENTGAHVFSYLRSKARKIPFILHTKTPFESIKVNFAADFPDENLQEYFLPKPQEFTVMRDHLVKLPVIQRSLKAQGQYHQIRIAYFLRHSRALCDVFIRLSDAKYVKIINRGDYFDQGLIQKYRDKEQRHLYIQNSDFDSFGSSLASHPFLVVDKNATPEQQLVATTLVVQDLAQTIGLTPSVIGLAKRQVEMVISEAKKIKGMRQLLLRLESRNDYIIDHSLMLSYLGVVLCDQLGWVTRNSREQLALAALFHDISIDDPDLAMVIDLGEPILKTLSKEEHKAFEHHPLLAAELVAPLVREFPGLEDIISQHHERPDGTGFPKKMAITRLRPLACLFIFCHHFVTHLYRHDFEPTRVRGLYKTLKSEMSVGHFIKIIEAFDSILPELGGSKE
jgi:response regulator RpfG family c-di-GMP phosphodiesterase